MRWRKRYEDLVSFFVVRGSHRGGAQVLGLVVEVEGWGEVMEIYGLDFDMVAPDVVGKEWVELRKEQWLDMVVADLGECDAKCCLITYEDDWYIVGVGAPLREFECLYEGKDLNKAQVAWLVWALQYTN